MQGFSIPRQTLGIIPNDTVLVARGPSPSQIEMYKRMQWALNPEDMAIANADWRPSIASAVPTKEEDSAVDEVARQKIYRISAEIDRLVADAEAKNQRIDPSSFNDTFAFGIGFDSNWSRPDESMFQASTNWCPSMGLYVADLKAELREELILLGEEMVNLVAGTKYGGREASHRTLEEED